MELRYAIPLLLNLLVAISAASVYLSSTDASPSPRNYRRVWIFIITQCTLFTYFADAFASLMHFFVYKSQYTNPVVYAHWLALVVHCIGSGAAYAFGTLAMAYALQRNRSIVQYVKAFYVTSAALETTVLVAWLYYIRVYLSGCRAVYADLALKSLHRLLLPP